MLLESTQRQQRNQVAHMQARCGWIKPAVQANGTLGKTSTQAVFVGRLGYQSTPLQVGQEVGAFRYRRGRHRCILAYARANGMRVVAGGGADRCIPARPPADRAKGLTNPPRPLRDRRLGRPLSVALICLPDVIDLLAHLVGPGTAGGDSPRQGSLDGQNGADLRRQVR